MDGLNKTTVWNHKTDTCDIKAINALVRDTTIAAFCQLQETANYFDFYDKTNQWSKMMEFLFYRFNYYKLLDNISYDYDGLLLTAKSTTIFIKWKSEILWIFYSYIFRQ